MAGQSVWHKDDIGRMCESTLVLALEANASQPSEFLRGVAAGVLAVAHSVGAPVRVPVMRRETDTVTVEVRYRE